MATAKKTKINWGVILGAVGILFVIWYLLTRKTAAGGTSGGGGIVGGGGSGSPYAAQQQPQSGGPSLGASFGPGNGGGGGSSSGLASALKNWVNGVLGQGYSNAATLQIDNGYVPGLGTGSDGLSIPDEPLSLFDVSQLTQDIPGYDNGGLDNTDLTDATIPDESFDWGGYSPNDFLVTSDIQTSADSADSADLSSFYEDPNDTVYQLTGSDLGASDSGGGGGVDTAY